MALFNLVCICAVIVSVVLTIYVLVSMIDIVRDWFKRKF